MKIEDYKEYYIQGSDHYLIPTNIFKELFNEMVNWKEESNQLKDRIDKLEKWLKEQIDYLTKIDGQNIPLKDGFEFCSMNELYQTGKYSGLKDSIEKLQELKGSDKNV